MRHRRYIAYILVTVLCLGAFAPGLLGVFPNVAKADTPGTYDDLYWYDFIDMLHEYDEQLNNNANYNMIELYDTDIQTLKDNDNFNCFVLMYDGKFALMYGENVNYTSMYVVAYTQNGILNHYSLRMRIPYFYENQYFRLRGYAVYDGTNLSCARGSWNDTTAGSDKTAAYNFSGNPRRIYPSPYEYNTSGYKCYSMNNLYGEETEYGMSANITFEQPVTPVEEFELLTFYLGSQLYITSNKQLIMARMDPETMDYDFCVGFYNSSAYQQEFIYFQDYDRVQINYPGNVVDQIVDTIPVGGIYAINITGIISEGYDEIYAVLVGNLEDETLAARASNVPISLSSEEKREEDEHITTWSTFNEYHNTYNTTHVIPQSLGDTLFGLNGSQIYPCNVMVPRSVWQNSPDHDSGTSFADAPTWLWWFPLIPDNLGFNYNLLDTIILSESSTGEYSVVYWYDDNLTKKFLKVKDQSFEDILQEFDCIIIVPDDDGCLRASTWWRDTLTFICNQFGFDAPSLLSALGICGSSSLGVEYVEDQPEEFTHELQGYALLTPKAIQKQLLWNFNDGITKLYQLEVDYIDSEDKWKDSFLLWSSSIFYAIDSLGGKLDSLITKLGNIEGKLDTLIQNTSEEDSSYWFISLWNWVVQFNPSDNDFANSLQQYDNNWNNMPSLPPPSPLPMLPGGV